MHAQTSGPHDESSGAEREAQGGFIFGCLIEGGLVVVAVLIAQLAGLPLRSTIHWQLKDVAWGLAGTLPLIVAFAWIINSRWQPLKHLAETLERVAGPVLGRWSVWKLALISILAGIGEELLFRAVAQGGLSAWLGTPWGLAIASVLFGALHCVTKAYFVIATLMGAWLGVLWLQTGNLLTPMITHAVYDFVALIWIFRVRPRPSGLVNVPPFRAVDE